MAQCCVCCTKRCNKTKAERVENLLWTSIRKNDLLTFVEILDQHPEIARTITDRLLLLICRIGNADFAEEIFKRNLYVQRVRVNLQLFLLCIVSKCKVELLNVICKYQGTEFIEKYLEGYGFPLFCVIQSAKQSNTPEERCIEMVQTLISYGADVNARYRPFKQDTPVHCAAKHGMWKVVRVLLSHGANIDLKIGSVTTRQIITSGNENFLEKYPHPFQHEPSLTIKEQMFEALYQNNEQTFIDLLNECVDPNIEDGRYNLIQLATEKNMKQAVESLLEGGSDPNRTSGVIFYPIYIAIFRGHFEVIEVLVKCDKTDLTMIDEMNHTIIHKLTLTWAKKTTYSDHEKDVATLLINKAIERGVDISHRNNNGNAALGIAGLARNSHVFKALLHKGALHSLELECMSVVSPEYLVEFFDSCISHTEDSYCKKYQKLILNYSFLRQPQSNYKMSHRESSNLEHDFMPEEMNPHPEMLPFYKISQSKKLQHVLKHPVVVNFLIVKWRHIYWIYFVNLITYLMFTIALTFNIHSKMSKIPIVIAAINSTSIFRTNIEGSHLEIIMLYTAVVLWMIILLRELIQMCSSVTHYFKSIENWLEIFILIVSFISLCPFTHLSKSIASIAIILCYTELTILIGTHPNVASYITMFLCVCGKSFRLILVFLPFIFSFAFSFHILFQNPNKSDLFFDLYSSVIRTMTMVTGEMEVDSIDFSLNPVTSQIVFSLFVVFVAIVLMNLLNALAVSDTQEIMRQAELVYCIATVKLYSKIESACLGYALDGHQSGCAFCCHGPLKCCLSCLSCFMLRFGRKIKINVIPFQSRDSHGTEFVIVLDKIKNGWRISRLRSFFVQVFRSRILGFNSKDLTSDILAIEMNKTNNITDTSCVLEKLECYNDKLISIEKHLKSKVTSYIAFEKSHSNEVSCNQERTLENLSLRMDTLQNKVSDIEKYILELKNIVLSRSSP